LPSADIAAALNCSFCVFKQRADFKQYLEACYASLSSPGMVALEIYCGADAQNLGRDEIELGGSQAIWEQVSFDPITSQCLNHVHFQMANGSLVEKAFVYDWRLWSPRL
jgi:hypothetical protein